jgi:hypothetical protein
MTRLPRIARGLALALPVILGSAPASAIQILYVQDFESPNNPPGFVDTTNRDVSQQTVNVLYGNQPEGFSFQQDFTVETLHITGGSAFGAGYSDPSGIGGNYAIGMLSGVQNDKLRLTFNVGSFDFFNLRMDISSIDLDGVGGPFGPVGGAVPEFRLTLFDSPGGVLGTTVLDSDTQSGTASPRNVFDWTSVIFALSTVGNTDGFVTVEIDLLSGNYAAFDNILIAAADTGGVVPVPGALPLLASALAGFGLVARRRAAD